MGEEKGIISAFASSYRLLKKLHKLHHRISSTSLLKFIQCCRDLETITVGDEGGVLKLDRSDFIAFVQKLWILCSKESSHFLP